MQSFCSNFRIGRLRLVGRRKKIDDDHYVSLSVGHLVGVYKYENMKCKNISIRFVSVILILTNHGFHKVVFSTKNEICTAVWQCLFVTFLFVREKNLKQVRLLLYMYQIVLSNGRFKGLDGGEGHVVVPGTGNIETRFRSFWIFCLYQGADDTIVCH